MPCLQPRIQEAVGVTESADVAEVSVLLSPLLSIPPLLDPRLRSNVPSALSVDVSRAIALGRVSTRSMRERAAQLGIQSTSELAVEPVRRFVSLQPQIFRRVFLVYLPVSHPLVGISSWPCLLHLLYPLAQEVLNSLTKRGEVVFRRVSLMKASADIVIVPGVSCDVSRVVSPARVSVPELVRDEEEAVEGEPASVAGDKLALPYVGSPDSLNDITTPNDIAESMRPSLEARLSVTQYLPVDLSVTLKLVSPLGHNVVNSGAGVPVSVSVEQATGPVS